MNVSDIEENELFRHICRLGAVRRKYKALKYGSFMNTVIRNEQLIFKRKFEDETIYVALNLSDKDFGIGFNTDGGAKLFDVYDGSTVYDVNNNYVNIQIPPHGTRILVLTNGEAPEALETPDTTTVTKSETAAPASESAVSESAETQPKPLPEVGTPGKYRHFKGGEYELICIAKDSETSEELVIYKELSGEGNIWARPSAIFYQYVDVDGALVPRFEKID